MSAIMLPGPVAQGFGSTPQLIITQGFGSSGTPPPSVTATTFELVEGPFNTLPK